MQLGSLEVYFYAAVDVSDVCAYEGYERLGREQIERRDPRSWPVEHGPRRGYIFEA